MTRRAHPQSAARYAAAGSPAAGFRRQARQRARRRAARARAAANATGMVAGFALDRLVGDPRRWHPVAGYGRLATALERRMYAPPVKARAPFTAIAVGMPVAAPAVAAVATRRRPLTRAIVTALATWAVLG